MKTTKQWLSRFLALALILGGGFSSSQVVAHGNHHTHSKVLTAKPKLFTDSTGLVYIGIGVPNNTVKPYLNQFNVIKGEKAFSEMRKNQATRDHNSFHVTLINPFELKEIDQGSFNFEQSFAIEFIGLGSAIKDSAETFFVVVESEKVQQVRTDLGLDKKDLHVTLGFTPNDVFGVSKGKDSLLEPAPKSHH